MMGPWYVLYSYGHWGCPAIVLSPHPYYLPYSQVAWLRQDLEAARASLASASTSAQHTPVSHTPVATPRGLGATAHIATMDSAAAAHLVALEKASAMHLAALAAANEGSAQAAVLNARIVSLTEQLDAAEKRAAAAVADQIAAAQDHAKAVAAGAGKDSSKLIALVDEHVAAHNATKVRCLARARVPPPHTHAHASSSLCTERPRCRRSPRQRC
jgi:hypothetical protein